MSVILATFANLKSKISLQKSKILMILDGEEKNLSEEFILKLFKAVHQESISHQERIINS